MDNNIYSELIQGELESSGVCNLACSYCYIPKDIKIQSNVNMKIIKQIEDGSFLNHLKDIYGEKLIQLSLWGTEPSLNVDIFIKNNFFEKQFNMFPKIEQISLSSNLMYNFQKLKRLIEHINSIQKSKNKIVKISIQFSLDGDYKINEKNRGKGTTDEIKKTLRYFQEYYETEHFKNNINNIILQHSFKPTFNEVDIEDFQNDENRCIEYIDFFDDIFKMFENVYKDNKLQNKIILNRNVTPTLQLPGEYTKQDGINFAKMYDNIFNIQLPYQSKKEFVNFSVPYLDRYIANISQYNKAYTEQSRNNAIFSCSQGDTMVGVSPNGDIQMCHHFFFLHDTKYKEFWVSGKEYNVERTKLKDVLDFQVQNQKNDNHVARLMYSLRGYHDYLRHRIDNTQIYVMNLKKLERVLDNNILENQNYTFLYSYFIQTQFSCPVNSILNTGTYSQHQTSIHNIWLNGQFEKLTKYFLRGDYR